MKTLHAILNSDPAQMFFVGMACGAGLVVALVF